MQRTAYSQLDYTDRPAADVAARLLMQAADAGAGDRSELIYHLASDASCGRDAKAIGDVENVSSWKINIGGQWSSGHVTTVPCPPAAAI